jgi:FixJ family two-component response regulator
MAQSPRVVAVVDDDSRVLESLEGLLESSGLRVRLFSSAKALLASTDLDSFNCVISDIGMPDVSGMELLSEIQREHSRVPVILITGRPLQESEEYYISRGARAFLQKPFDGRDLLKILRDAMEDTCSDSSFTGIR